MERELPRKRLVRKGITGRSAAQILGLGETTVRRLIERGDLEAQRSSTNPRGWYRISLESIRAFRARRDAAAAS